MKINEKLLKELRGAFVDGFIDRRGRMPRHFFNPRREFVIVTGESRDRSRMWNGGEYEYYAVYHSRRGRGWDKCSCDFWQPESNVFRFPPMSRMRFVQHVRIARKLAVRKYREM